MDFRLIKDYSKFFPIGVSYIFACYMHFAHFCIFKFCIKFKIRSLVISLYITIFGAVCMWIEIMWDLSSFPLNLYCISFLEGIKNCKNLNVGFWESSFGCQKDDIRRMRCPGPSIELFLEDSFLIRCQTDHSSIGCSAGILWRSWS